MFSGERMLRRKFITLFGGAAATWPLVVRAQQPTMPVIGLLSGASFETMRELVAAFQQGLADAGFVEGRNVAIEYRWAEGNNDRLPALVMDLVRREVAVIVVVASTPGALAAHAATQTIPIVFFIGTDPVKVGLVASLARPAGNITGVTDLVVELLAKTLELAHNLMPSDTTIAVLVNPANVTQTAFERAIVQNEAHGLGARVLVLNASSPNEIELAFETLVSERIGVLVVSGENFFLTQRGLLVELAARHAVPTIYAAREFTSPGVSCPTERLRQGDYVKLALTQAASSRAKKLLTSRCSKLRKSSWPSISRPPRRSASQYRPRCSAVPMK
jgi:putative ABC transport system substrate-binding protein